MAEKARKGDLFTHKNHITWLMARRARSPEAKRRIIEMANGKLFYIFGYTLPNTGEKC
jgi:hypothetical protein